MKRPKNLELKHIKELAKTLRKQPCQYSIEKLNKALELSKKENLKQHSNKVLNLVSELISYVKYAEDDGHFYALQEKVDLAVTNVISSDAFTIEQLKWYNIIRDFVITRLKITKQDVNSGIVFRKVGGFANLDKVFNGKLQTLMDALNEAVLA